MKKSSVIAFLVFIAIILACSVKLLSIKKIELTNLKNNEIKMVYSNDDTLNIIKHATRNCNKIDKEINTENYDYKLVIEHYVGKNEIAYLSFDYNNKKIYLIKNGNIYEIKKNATEDIFICEDFSYIYIEATAPKMILKENSKELELSKQYNWAYKKINNSLYEERVEINEDKNVLNINDLENYKIEFDIIPDNYIIKVFKNGKVIKTAKTIKEAFEDITKDGNYLVEVEAEWYKKLGRDNYGTQTIDFLANLDYPAELEILSTNNYPGDILSVFVKNVNEDDTVNLLCTAINFETKNYTYNGGIINIMPISVNAIPGQYEIRCIVNKGKKNEYCLSKVFTVNEKKFKTQYLQIDESISDKTRTEIANQEYLKIVKSSRECSFDEMLWQDKFIMPVEGVLTTDFAEIRYINDEKEPTVHSGIDLAAPTGTKVKASNTGIVKVSRYLTLTGNTVVIDHGMGLFTTYYHLDSLNLVENNIVNKGDIIGTLGTTGFSTGPHLHFSVSIYNECVNPYQPITGLFK
ncbi:M23 family metallopeptidase [Sedimentibacter sp. zth1]|uniref:M23 family metallopeptidase n=1 Tax=Sedimentibacter sp. zth1 TaxID=2816908 RepID=UPI001A917C8E|nr:M23 family metallopeptidase [Sedimentibacter sp. zth1]QSX05065.1 M23 family metallopeptidase [Sedimentibacter sp. zth1]